MYKARTQFAIDGAKVVKRYQFSVAHSEKGIHPKKKATTEDSARSFEGEGLILLD